MDRPNREHVKAAEHALGVLLSAAGKNPNRSALRAAAYAAHEGLDILERAKGFNEDFNFEDLSLTQVLLVLGSSDKDYAPLIRKYNALGKGK